VSLTSGLLIALFLLAVIGTSLGRRVSVSGPSSALLRCLFPSWRFFGADEPSLCLLARVVREQREVRPFAPLLPAPPHSFRALFFNPRGNLLLACHGLLDRLVSDLAELGPTPIPDAERLVSYRLVQNLALSFLAASGAAEGSHYQLKLVATEPGQDQPEELFVSPLYPFV
jgi:hypothetical protein